MYMILRILWTLMATAPKMHKLCKTWCLYSPHKYIYKLYSRLHILVHFLDSIPSAHYILSQSRHSMNMFLFYIIHIAVPQTPDETLNPTSLWETSFLVGSALFFFFLILPQGLKRCNQTHTHCLRFKTIPWWLVYGHWSMQVCVCEGDSIHYGLSPDVMRAQNTVCSASRWWKHILISPIDPLQMCY